MIKLLNRFWILAIFLVSVVTCGNQTHPRLFINETEFSELKQKVLSSPSSPLRTLHEGIITYADKCLKNKEDVVYQLDGSDKRLSGSSIRAMEVLTTCSYAYRFTKEKKYLDFVEKKLKGLCSLKDWNAKRHTLNTSEIGVMVSVAYDWLYHDLQPSTRTMIEEKLVDYLLEPVSRGEISMDFFKRNHNWNQVCNAGVICASLVLDGEGEFTKSLIEKSVKSNRRAVSKMYSPEGNYPEGPHYWTYGTSYQVVILDALNSCLGHDYGISDLKGLAGTGTYKLFTNTPEGKVFNYSDNADKVYAEPTLWYFADRYDDPSILYNELRLLKRGDYFLNGSRIKLLPLMMGHAANIDFDSVLPPSRKIYVGRGKNPVVMIHKDWTFSETDSFLGIKAGYARVNHAHMDAGSFVFVSEGVRWAAEIPREAYVILEKTIRQMGGHLFAMDQDSFRWDVFANGNKRHNTLTINDAKHQVAGKAKLVSVIDTAGRMGAVMDLTEVFETEAASVHRTVEMVGEDLIIRDVVTALETKDAHIRWTLASFARPRVTRYGIVLKKEGKKRYLKVDSPDAEYHIFEAKPSRLDDVPQLRKVERRYPGTHLAGFTLTVPSGQTKEFVTVLSK